MCLGFELTAADNTTEESKIVVTQLVFHEGVAAGVQAMWSQIKVSLVVYLVRVFMTATHCRSPSI